MLEFGIYYSPMCRTPAYVFQSVECDLLHPQQVQGVTAYEIDSKSDLSCLFRCWQCRLSRSEGDPPHSSLNILHRKSKVVIFAQVRLTNYLTAGTAPHHTTVCRIGHHGHTIYTSGLILWLPIVTYTVYASLLLSKHLH